MAEYPVEPREVAELVERFVSKQLADAGAYDNREPLDESGVYELHELAAKVYAIGVREGEYIAYIRARGERQRARKVDRG